MREKKRFAERTVITPNREIRKKYFLVYEGKETEVLYFDALNKYRNEIGINPIIELKPLVRSYGEEGWSNPKKILDRLIQNLEEDAYGMMSYETLINRLMDYLLEKNLITASKSQQKSIWEILIWECVYEQGKQLNYDVENIEQDCEILLDTLFKKANISNISDNIVEIIQNSQITYDKIMDKICIIVDRDRKSFSRDRDGDQFGYVLNKCREKDFQFYVTNPCFEFWILLHFDGISEIDEAKLLKNDKVTSKKNYIEKKLTKVFNGYKKSDYDADFLVLNLNTALANVKKYCVNINELDKKPGSNLGDLIEELRN